MGIFWAHTIPICVHLRRQKMGQYPPPLHLRKRPTPEWIMLPLYLRNNATKFSGEAIHQRYNPPYNLWPNASQKIFNIVPHARVFINRIAAMPMMNDELWIDEFFTRYLERATFYRGAATPSHASQMRWLFVGAALVLRKEQRISLCS
jgi:hypothetical protein